MTEQGAGEAAMTDTTFMRTWAEIDLDALDHNYKTLRGETEAGCRFLGLCKANAYGHGAAYIGPELQRLGATVVLVDSQEAGVRLVHTLMACAEAVQQDNLKLADKLVKQDLKDKVSPDHVEKVNKVTQEIRDAIASNNIENIRAKIQDLKNILAEISTQAYQSAGASSAQAGTAGPEFTGGGPTGSAAGPTGSAAGPNPSP